MRPFSSKPSFLETKIEDKFFVLKSKNDKDKNKLLKKEIDLNYIQFHFVVDGNATFSFNNGAYKMDVSKGKYIVLYNPKKNLPVDALIHAKSYVLSVLISIKSFKKSLSFINLESFTSTNSLGNSEIKRDGLLKS